MKGESSLMLEQQKNQLKRQDLDEKQKKKRGRPHLLKVSTPSEKVLQMGIKSLMHGFEVHAGSTISTVQN